jgi:peptidoglycan/LPS O-acetylase OafA/YrhL
LAVPRSEWGLSHLYVAAMTAGLIGIIATDHEGPHPRRMLDHPVATYLGLISYGIYVYHYILAKHI